MALVLAQLYSDLTDLFSDPPPTSEECAQKWGQILLEFVLPITPPTTTAVLASEILEAQLLSAFAATELTGSPAVPQLEIAFAAFATSLGLGMAPAWVATPPPAPVNFASLIGDTCASSEFAANLFASLIYLWISTGTAVNSGGAT